MKNTLLIEVHNDIDNESILFIELDKTCKEDEIPKIVFKKLEEIGCEDLLETFPIIIHRNWRIENE